MTSQDLGRKKVGGQASVNNSFVNNTVSIEKVYSPERNKCKVKTTKSGTGVTSALLSSGNGAKDKSSRRSNGSRHRSRSATGI